MPQSGIEQRILRALSPAGWNRAGTGKQGGLFVHEQRCGRRWPAIDASEIKRPARPPKPFSHINFKGSAIPAFKSPTGDIRIKEVIEECGIVDRLNSTPGGRTGTAASDSATSET